MPERLSTTSENAAVISPADSQGDEVTKKVWETVAAAKKLAQKMADTLGAAIKITK